MDISEKDKRLSQAWKRILELEKENISGEMKNDVMVKKIMLIIEDEVDKCY